MGSYVLTRALHGVLLAIAVSVLTFALLDLAPGSYFDELKANPNISPETVSILKTRYGLEQSLPVRYEHWLKSVVRGDLGISMAYNMPVAALLLPRAKNTLLLTGLATLLAWTTAIPLGIWSSSRRRGCGSSCRCA